MAEFLGQLIERLRRTPTIESLRFATETPVAFQAGQFLRVMLDPDTPNNNQLNKFLSFSARPRAGYVEVTKRMTGSAFCRGLQALREGDSVRMNGPFGKAVYEEGFHKIGFLIGGIGITAVMSILGHIAENTLPVDVVLLYTNRSQDEIAFKDVLDGYTRSSGFRIIYTVDQTPADDPNIHFGRIDADLVQRVMPDIASRVVFSYGPPAMVSAMKELSLAMGVSSQQLRTENFIGY